MGNARVSLVGGAGSARAGDRRIGARGTSARRLWKAGGGSAKRGRGGGGNGVGFIGVGCEAFKQGICPWFALIRSVVEAALPCADRGRRI